MSGIMDRVNAFGRGAAQGATAGFGDELGASLLQYLPKPDDGTGIPRSYEGGEYAQLRDSARADDAEAQRKFPANYMAGQVAGGAPAATAAGLGVAGSLPAAGLAGGLMAGLHGAGTSEATTGRGVASDAARAAGPGALMGVAAEAAPVLMGKAMAGLRGGTPPAGPAPALATSGARSSAGASPKPGPQSGMQLNFTERGDRIRQAAEGMAGSDGRVYLKDLRKKFPEIPPNEFDDEVRNRMFNEQDVILNRIDDNSAITPEIEASKIDVAGQPRHFMNVMNKDGSAVTGTGPGMSPAMKDAQAAWKAKQAARTQAMSKLKAANYDDIQDVPAPREAMLPPAPSKSVADFTSVSVPKRNAKIDSELAAAADRGVTEADSYGAFDAMRRAQKGQTPAKRTVARKRPKPGRSDDNDK